MISKRIKTILAKLALSCFSVVLTVFVADGFIGRFLDYGGSPIDRDVPFSSRQSPNVRYEPAYEPFSFVGKHNSDGFRERELPRKPYTKGKRIVCVGDSFTYGWGVDAEDSWVRVMERGLNSDGEAESWDVINLGMFGMSPSYYRDVLLEFGEQLKPDIVLVGYMQNNDALAYNNEPMTNLRRARFHEKLLRFYPEHFIAYFRNRLALLGQAGDSTMPGTFVVNPLQRHIDSEDPVIHENIKRIDPELFQKALEWTLPPYVMYRNIAEPDVLAWDIKQSNMLIEHQAIRRILQDIKETVSEWGGETKIVLFPQGWTINKLMWPELQTQGGLMREGLLHDRRFQDSMIHFADGMDIEWLDLRQTLLDTEELAYLEFDEHFNDLGNAVSGQTIADWLLGRYTKPEPAAVEPAPPFQVVKEWHFDTKSHAEGWTIGPYRNKISVKDGSLRMHYNQNCVLGKPVALFNNDYRLDCDRVNRLRVRMKINKGKFASFLWGSEPTYTYDRMIPFPILPDGNFHEYDIALDHCVADWSGQWPTLRLEPTHAFPKDEDLTGQTVEIDWIAVGYCEPTIAPPNVWANLRKDQISQ